MDNAKLTGVKFYHGDTVPLELHKVRIVQKLHLRPVGQRLKAIEAGGYNTFLLNTTDIFLDMLTDSGTNAMSDNQLSSMLHADDAYAGSQSFYRMEKALQDVSGRNTSCRCTRDGRRKMSSPGPLSGPGMSSR